MHEDGGALHGLVEDDRLDNRTKLIDLLSQLLFIAGPGHAAHHHSGTHYYRYAPVYPGAAYAPPPWKEDRVHRARYCSTLPDLRPAVDQVFYAEFTNYRYDRFGDYAGYDLARPPEYESIRERLRADLDEIAEKIRSREAVPAGPGHRRLPYEFLLPENVPNSVTI